MYDSLAERLREQSVKDHKKKISRAIVAASIAITGIQFWLAQLVVWGLSMYHIHSGIWPVWLIMEAVSSLLTACVRIGMMGAVRDTRN